MKGVIFRRLGGPDVLELVDLPEPVADVGEVLITVEAISVEAGDIARRQHGPLPPPDRAIGYVAAGKVRRVGPGVTGFRIGDRVVTFDFGGGGYAALRTAPVATTHHVPAGVDSVAAAAALVSFQTAAEALTIARPQRGETILIQGAAGGVGIALVQLSHRAGLRVLGTSSSAASLEMLRAHGLNEPIVTKVEPVAVQVDALTESRGVDMLIDNIGGTAFEDALPALADGGRAVMVGVPTGFPKLDAMQMLLRRLTVSGCYLGETSGNRAQRKMVVEALDGLATGALTVLIDKTFPLEMVNAAHRRADERGRIGKVVLIPSHSNSG